MSIIICPVCKQECSEGELQQFEKCFFCYCDIDLADEEIEFDIYYQQHQRCFKCSHELWHWKTEMIAGIRRAVCVDCNNPGEPPIKITRESLNLKPAT